MLREAAVRAAIIDTSWSAAFISYVVRQSGVTENAFRFANAHRVYIYDAFAASAAELANKSDERLYRACPVSSTRPRVGDLICQQREPALADASDEAVRERVRGNSAAARMRARSGAPIARWSRISMRARARCIPSAATLIRPLPPGSLICASAT